MTTEREAAGPEGASGAAGHELGTRSPRLHWQRRATVVDEVHATFELPGGAGDLLGWTTAELQCAPYLEFVHPDDRELLAEAGDDLRASRVRTAFVPLEMRVLARDRRYWWTRWTVALTEDGTGVRASGVDYLAPQPTKGPPVGTWYWDADADTVSWSTELLDMFGFKVGPPVAYGDFLAAVLEDDRDGIDRAIRQTLCRRRSVRGRLRDRRPRRPRALVPRRRPTARRSDRRWPGARRRAQVPQPGPSGADPPTAYWLRLIPARTSTAAGTPTSRHDE